MDADDADADAIADTGLCRGNTEAVAAPPPPAAAEPTGVAVTVIGPIDTPPAWKVVAAPAVAELIAPAAALAV